VLADGVDDVDFDDHVRGAGAATLEFADVGHHEVAAAERGAHVASDLGDFGLVCLGDVVFKVVDLTLCHCL